MSQPQPKPPPREPKPRKWIRRTRIPKRSTILRAASSSDYRTRERRCNRLWVQAIYRKGRVGIWCERCLKRPWKDAAHCFIKGKYRGLRFEPANGWPLCRHCHGEVDSDHLAKETFFRRVLGDQEYERLELRAKTTRGKTDLALVEIYLRRILGRVDHGREEAASPAPPGQLQP